MKRIMSIVLMAIFLASMASMLPARAINPTWGIEVYTKATTIGGVVQFAANITQLKPGWTGSQVDTYISTNGYANINPNTDLKLPFASGLYIAELNYTYAEFTLTPSLVEQLLDLPGNTAYKSQPYIYLYIKMTDNISTTVSNRFILILKSSKYVDFNVTKLSYVPFNEGGLTTYNAIHVFYNLTDLNAQLFTIDLTQYNISIDAYIPTTDYNIFYLIANSTTPTSDVFSGVSDFELTSTTLAFNGTLKDFAVNSTGTYSVYGIPIAYARFEPAMNAIEGDVDMLQAGSKVAFISASGVDYEILTDNFTINATRISITGADYNETSGTSILKYFDVFPSLEIVDMNASYNPYAPANPAAAPYETPNGGLGDIMNPGDLLINVTGHNFPIPANMTFCLFAFTDSSSVEKIYTWSGVVTNVLSTGNFTVNLTLPNAPYGAREIIIVPRANTSATSFTRGLFAHIGKVYPYIIVEQLSGTCSGGCMGFDLAGEVALGEYLLIKGYGFNVGESVSVVDNVTGEDLSQTIYAGSNVADSDGSVLFISRMPYDTVPSMSSTFWYDPDYREHPGCPLCWVDMVYTVYMNNTYMPTIVTDGSRYFIFMDPTPTVDYDTFDGCIALNNITKIPHKAYDNYLDPSIGWVETTEDDVTVMHLELIGIDINLDAVNVSMTNTSLPASFVTLSDLPLTNGYANVKMPVASEAPCALYQINASSTESSTMWWSTTENSICQYLAITHTLAARNLNRGPAHYGQAIYVAVLNDNLSFVGYGWRPGYDINVSVYMYNRTINAWEITPVITFSIPASNITDLGSFNYTVLLNSSYKDNSIYKFELSQTGCGGVEDVYVYINITPTLFVELKTGHAHVPGGLLNIFVKPIITALPPEAIMSDYEFESQITIYYFDGTSWVGETLTTPDTTLEGFMVFTWHIPSNVVGGEVLVKAYLTAYNRWAPNLIRSSYVTYDTVSIMTQLNNEILDLQDMLTHAQEVIVNNITEGVANITAVINGSMTTITASLSDLQSMLGELNVKVSDLQTAVDLYGGQVLTALNAISSQLTSINVTINEGFATVETNLGTIKASLDDVASMLNETKTVIIEEVGKNLAQISTKLDNATLTITGSLDNITSLIKKVSSGFTLSDIKLFITAAKSEVLASIDTSNMQIVDKLDTLNAVIENGVAKVDTHLGKIDANISTIQKALSDIMSSVSDVKATVNTKGNEIITTITNGNGKVLAQITATTNAVNKARADILNSIESAKSDLATSISNAQNSIANNMNTKASQLSNSISSGFADTKKSVDNINSNVTIYGATSVVLLVIALGLAAYGILVRKK